MRGARGTVGGAPGHNVTRRSKARNAPETLRREAPGMTLPTLDGFSVGITADRRWEEQAELLRRRGATVLHGPTIKTYALGPEDGLRRATDAMCLRPPDVLIANTGIGMRSWFAAAESWGVGDALIGALGEAYVVARGPKASGAVHQAGLTVDAISENGRLREVVELVLEFGVEGKTVAFHRPPRSISPSCAIIA